MRIKARKSNPHILMLCRTILNGASSYTDDSLHIGYYDGVLSGRAGHILVVRYQDMPAYAYDTKHKTCDFWRSPTDWLDYMEALAGR